MSYSAKGNRPFEWASKSQHTHVINDPFVQKLLSRCKFPSNCEEAEIDVKNHSFEIDSGQIKDINTVIAVDGGYTEVIVKQNYPESKVAFFQFGGLAFNLDDLKKLADLPFINPDDLEKFKQIERFKFAIPTKAISIDSHSMIDSVRIPLIEFFNEKRERNKTFLDTLKWLVFHEYKNKGNGQNKSLQKIIFGSLPKRNNHTYKNVCITKSAIKQDGYFDYEGEKFNLIDIFRFHEVVDEELGASGILGYLTNVIEHIIIVHYLKEIITRKAAFLKHILLIKDGPLGLFGQTANLHKHMRELCNFCIENYAFKLVGIEKSGTFVEHADNITSGEKPCLQEGQVLPLFNQYIYKHILPGPSSEEELEKLPPYASTSYYSGKIIYHSKAGKVWVLTLPIKNCDEIKTLNKNSFHNLEEILNTVDLLKCDRFENAIIPISFINQLVSLANHPSSRILEKFAKNLIND